jgi:predicted transcriptional regulator
LSLTAFRNRSKHEIIYDMLSLCDFHPMIKTDLMYKSNLSFFQVQRYIKILTHRNLVTANTAEGRRRYFITDKGREYVHAYQQLIAAYD